MNQKCGASDDDRVRQKLIDAQFMRSVDLLSSSCEDCFHLRLGTDTNDTKFAACRRLNEFIIAPGKWEECALHADLMTCGCRFFQLRGVQTEDALANIAMMASQMSPFPDVREESCDCDLYQTYLQVDTMIHELEVFAESLPDDGTRSEYLCHLNELRMYIRMMILGEEDELDDEEEKPQ